LSNNESQQKLKVLVVEDNLINQMVTKKIIEKIILNVIFVKRDSSYKKLENAHYDVI